MSATSYNIENTLWEVRERYVNLTPIGSGAYGTVCSAIDRRTGLKVAIKKLYRPFQSETFAKRAYRELKLLKHMKHENAAVANRMNGLTLDVPAPAGVELRTQMQSASVPSAQDHLEPPAKLDACPSVESEVRCAGS